MTPKAEVDDGFLDFIYAPLLGRFKLLTLLPKALSGTHIDDPAVKMHRTTRLEIRTDPATPIQTDGELMGYETTEILYEVIPGGLQVFTT